MRTSKAMLRLLIALTKRTWPGRMLFVGQLERMLNGGKPVWDTFYFYNDNAKYVASVVSAIGDDTRDGKIAWLADVCMQAIESNKCTLNELLGECLACIVDSTEGGGYNNPDAVASADDFEFNGLSVKPKVTADGEFFTVHDAADYPAMLTLPGGKFRLIRASYKSGTYQRVKA